MPAQNATLPTGGLVEAPVRYPITRGDAGSQQRRLQTDAFTGATLALDVRFIPIVSTDTAENRIAPRPVRPVSYTHLDVYKRQVCYCVVK